MNSFRLKFALLAGGSVALLLLAVGFFAWKLTVRFNLDRLDREIRHLAKGNLERIGDHSHWARVYEALSFVAGSGQAPTYAIWVKNYDREEYRSPRWPNGIEPEKFAEPKSYEGGLVFATPPRPPRREQISTSNPALPTKEPYFLSVKADGSVWRVGVTGNPYTTLVLAANLDEFNTDLDRLRWRFLAALPLALFLVGGGAWLLASRAIRPVRALTTAVEGITERGLDQRISAPAHDLEFQRLVTVFNAMMNRLEQGFLQARRFSADASHELKTPLALLQAEIENALHSAPSGSTEQQAYTSLLEEVHHLKAILEKLLLLSLADSGHLTLQKTTVDLDGIVADIIEDCTALAPGLRIEKELSTGIQVDADPVLLEQALQNLLGNAVKYNCDGGMIRVTLAVKGDSAELIVGNTGVGIPEQDQAKVFERFYRTDPARRRDHSSGAGLGLSLSREIIRAHSGELVLKRAKSGWTEFAATLPLATPSKDQGTS